MKESIFRLFFSVLLSKDSSIEVFNDFIISVLVDHIFNMSSFERSPSSHDFGPHAFCHFLTVEI